MLEMKLITCVVERGKADRAVQAAIDAGAQGATIFYARGTGVRQKLGLLGSLIRAEKEVILIGVKEDEIEKVFAAIVEAAELHKPAKGFAFIHSIEKVVGFVPPKK